jgi:peptidyl-prolyl cis-trans isomerase D
MEAETRYKNEVRQLGGEKHLRSALSCNNMTPDQFRKAIFRNLSIKWYLDQEIYSRIVIQPGETKSYYEENRSAFTVPESVRLRQIFIRGPKEKDEAKWRSANERALNIYRAARDGANFVNLARKYSEDPSGANVGGDMGVLQKENIHDTFRSVLFSLDDGAVTEPLRSRHGFHIFNIIIRTPPTTKPFQDVQNEITTTLRKRHAQEMVGKLIEELRTKAEIVITGRGGQ